MSRSAIALLPLVLSLLALLSPVSGQNYFAFCYTIQNTLVTSPYLPFTVQTSGVLTTSSSIVNGLYGGYGYRITAASGTRQIWYLNGQSNTQSITGVATPGTYNGNDNIIQGAAPYFDNVLHGVTFTLGGTAVFAGGPVNSSVRYVNINNYTTPLAGGAGISESDNPVNDGAVVQITSTFTLTQVPSSSATPNCTALSAPSIPAATLTSWGQSKSWNFCYSFTGGPGDGTFDGSIWYVSASGTLTTAGYGVTSTGLTAYLVTGVMGQRQFIFGNGTVITATFTGVGGVNSADAVAPSDPQFSSYFYSNNVFYPTYPFTDNYGVTLVASTDLSNVDLTDLSTNVLRIFIDPSDGEFEEWIVDFNDQTYYAAEAGTIVAADSSTNLGQGLQSACMAQSGTGPVTYSFCYYIDGTSHSTPYFEYAYGTLSAYAGLIRYGRPAMAVQTITGVRSMTRRPGPSQQQYNTNIINLLYIKEDLGIGILNDNILFTDGGNPFTELGLLFTMAYPPAFAIENSTGTDINLYLDTSSGTAELVEIPADSSTNGIASTVWGFSYSPYVAGQQQTCSSSSSLINIGSQNTFQFCYYFEGVGGSYSVFASGTVTTYPTPIIVTGRAGYAIQGITGSRTFKRGNVTQTVAILGLLANSSVSWDGPIEWLVDQIIFPTWPAFDVNGLLYTVPGGTLTPNGPISNVGVINLYVDSQNVVTELTLTNSATVVTELVAGSLSVSAANAAASTWNSTQQCNWHAGTSATYSFCTYIESDSATTGTPWSIVSYGLFTALGPVSREGRQAYTVTSIQGQRTVTVQGRSSTTQQILQLLGVKDDLADASIINDNVVYATSPYLDDLGLLYQLDSPAVYPSGIAGSDKINLYFDQSASTSSRGLTQYVDWNLDDSTFAETSISGFAFAPYNTNGQGSYVSCGAADSSIIVPQAKYFEFCYFISGATYTVAGNGFIATEGVPITAGGRLAYVATGINGTRTYTNTQTGAVNTVNIVGLVAVPSEFQTWDNLVFPTWPYYDVGGLTFTTDGAALTSNDSPSLSPDLSTPNWFNLWTTAGGDFQELTYTTLYTGGVTLVLGDAYVYPVSGTVPQTPLQLQSKQCNRATAGTQQTYQYCYVMQPNDLQTGNTQYTLAVYGTWTAAGPVFIEGRNATNILAGNVPYTGARVLTDGSGATSYQLIRTVQPVKADLSTSWYNDNAAYYTQPYLDQYGVIFGLSGAATYANTSTGSTVTSGSNQINVWYDQFGTLAYWDQSIDGVNYATSSGLTFSISRYNAANYPPAYCQGVQIPQGTWTTQTGGVIGRGIDGGGSFAQSSSSSSSGLSIGAIAGIVIGVVFGVIFTLLLLAILYCVASRGSKGSSDAGYSANSKYSQQAEQSHVEPSQMEMATIDDSGDASEGA